MLAKPDYRLHRVLRSIIDPATPIAADSTTLDDLLVYSAIPVGGGAAEDHDRRNIFDAGGWRTVRGVVRLTGGTAPTADLEPLELTKLKRADSSVTRKFVSLASPTGALSNLGTFTATINGGLLFMRLNAITGTPDSLEIFLAGAEAMNVMPGAHREL
jgi:hypothetical protein